MSNWAKATDVEETALTDEMFFIWSQREALWDMVFAVAQLKSGASSQPTVNNLVSYTEEVFFFILFFY